MTSHFLYPSADKARMNVQYAYACFYLVHTPVARLQHKERSRLGAEELTGKDKTGNKNQGREISRTWKNKQSRRAVREEDGWTDTEQTHGNQEALIQWI